MCKIIIFSLAFIELQMHIIQLYHTNLIIKSATEHILCYTNFRFESSEYIQFKFEKTHIWYVDSYLNHRYQLLRKIKFKTYEYFYVYFFIFQLQNQISYDKINT